MEPSPYPPPEGEALAVSEGAAFYRGSRKTPGGETPKKEAEGRPLQKPSEGRPPKPHPLRRAPPKGGGSLVSTHAALSPELGSKRKARSGRKSGTTAPGVQGAGRGPLATSLVTFLFAQESNPPVGAGPDNPSGRMPENSKRKKLFSYQPTGGRRETQS